MKHSFYIPLQVVLFSLMAIIPATGQGIYVPITAVDGGGHSGTITFGFHPEATYCIDGQIDTNIIEWEIPITPSGVFEFYFSEHRNGGCSLGLGVLTHIQEINKADTFRIQFYPGYPGYPFTFTWPSGLDTIFSFLYLKDPLGVYHIQENLLIDTIFQVVNPMINTLDIIGAVILSSKREEEIISPQQYSLTSNYPNPFNPSTEISYSIPKSGLVTLKISDILGGEVTTLVNERKEIGRYRVEWNAEGYPSGIYFYRLTAGTFTETKKMVLMK